ncbi:hypothetical protein Q7P36_004602 [Cladosporium allicinum]
MPFQCTACWDKSYDKAWKLQRHVRESKKCFERINPGMPANHLVRFQCFSCGYASPREPDLDRHRRRVHGETDNPIASGRYSTTRNSVDTISIPDLLQPESPHDRTFPVKPSQSDAGNCSSELDITHHTSDLSTDSSTSLDLASIYSRQSIATPTTGEGSGKIEEFDLHLRPLSQVQNAKRKSPYRDHLSSAECKRLCAEIDLASNTDVKDVSTNEKYAPEHELDLGSEPGNAQDVPELDFHPNKTTDSTAFRSGERFEADASFVDALANIDLTSPAEDHKPFVVIESYAKDRRGFLRNEPWAPVSWKSTLGLWTESVPTHDVHTNLSIHSSPILPSNPKRKSIVTSSSGTPQSINSKGSLFGIPSTHSYKPWMAWSSGSVTQSSAAKSLHSNGMPAPMLNSVDEELSLSRAWTSEERPHSITLSRQEPSHLTPQEEFGLAAADDDVEPIRLLVEDLAFDCNHRDHEGRTALVWAAERGHHQAVEILLSNSSGGVDANAQDDRGMTAIMFACHRGDLHVFDSLIYLPAIGLGIQNNAGPTAFMIAIQSSDPDSAVIVKKLVSHVQTRPDYHTTAAKWHPIFNAQDDRGLTPLHWAVKLRRHDWISVLLETGQVDVNMKALDGNTAAMHAVEELIQPDILELLFDRKACDPTVMNERGETLVGVAWRAVQEKNDMLAVSARLGIRANWRRLQTARDNLCLCKAYASHYAGEQDQAVGSSTTPGPGL